VSAFDVAGGLYGPHDAHLVLARGELLVLVLLPRLLEQHDSVVVHQVFQELLLLTLEQVPPLVLQVAHLLYLLVVVNNTQVPLRPVYYHYHAFLYVLERLERLQ
jgi:hypothetical protein